jgi:hypothetical protein
MSYLSTLVEERETLAASIATITDRAEAEGRDITDAELAEVRDIKARAEAIDTRLATFAETQDANARYADLAGRIESRRSAKAEQTSAAPSLSFGEQVLASAEFRSWQGFGTMPRFTLDVSPLEVRAPGDPIKTTDAGAARQRLELSATPGLLTPVLSIIGREPVSSNAVDWIEYPVISDAAVVPEGSPKPAATWLPAIKTGSLDTIAHYLQVTRQAVEDNARLRSLIEGELLRGVQSKVEKDAAAAITGATFPAAPGVAGTGILGAVRAGIAAVQSAGFNPTAVLLNPDDYAEADVELLGRSFGGTTVNASFWGLRVAWSSEVTAGSAYVGDFTTAVKYLDRGTTAVYMTDSHADNFLANVFTLLGETRGKTVVVNPNAVAEVTVTPAP